MLNNAYIVQLFIIPAMMILPFVKSKKPESHFDFSLNHYGLKTH